MPTEVNAFCHLPIQLPRLIYVTENTFFLSMLLEMFFSLTEETTNVVTASARAFNRSRLVGFTACSAKSCASNDSSNAIRTAKSILEDPEPNDKHC